tara:strand:+ start:24 stop:191 length:168 start_codon:yes stop_codon:yes gene_type:complete
MIEILLATALECEGSQELIEKVMGSQEPLINKHELIEVIKVNTEPGCYEGSESST